MTNINEVVRAALGPRVFAQGVLAAAAYGDDGCVREALDGATPEELKALGNEVEEMRRKVTLFQSGAVSTNERGFRLPLYVSE